MKYTVSSHTGSTLTFTAKTKEQFTDNLLTFLGKGMMFNIDTYERFYTLGVTKVETETRVIFLAEPEQP